MGVGVNFALLTIFLKETLDCRCSFVPCITLCTVGSDDTDGRWEPSLCGGTDCSVYVMNYCSTCGHTCLVFRSDPNSHGGELS